MSRKFHIHIKASTEEQLKDELKELAYIITGMRQAQKRWHNEFGSASLKQRKEWEEKADEWIEQHKTFID
jgi:hypothetical protein